MTTKSQTPINSQVREELSIKTNLIEKEESIIKEDVLIKENMIDKHKDKIKKTASFIWKQKFLDRDGRQIVNSLSMWGMNRSFLQNISFKTQLKIQELNKSLEIQYALLEQIDIVADEKEYELEEISQNNNN